MIKLNVTGLLVYPVLFGGWFFGLDILLVVALAWLLHTNPVFVIYKTKKYKAAEEKFRNELRVQEAAMYTQLFDIDRDIPVI